MIPLALLLALTALRLAVAGLTPLSADEAYYWVWSRALAPGYPDHPPMVALWIRLGTALAGDTALGVRLLGPISAAIGSVLLADAAERLFPGRRVGLPAAVLLNATLMFGVGAVTMTPDTPLLFFCAAALWGLTRVPGDGRWWMVVGLAGGLALESKYTAVLLGFAVLLWLAWVPALRGQFRCRWLWLAVIVAAGLFLPVVAWNADHGWASFVRQGGRAGEWHPELRYLGELFLGQFALATPLVFLLFAAGLGRSGRRALARDPSWSLLASLSLPGLGLFLQHAIGDRVQANWLAVLYPPLAIAAAAAGSRGWRPAAALGFAVTALVYIQAAAAPLPLPRRLDPTLIRLAGWDGLAAEAERMRQETGAAYLASEEYGLASLLAWGTPGPAEVAGVEPRWALFRLPRAGGGTGLLLISQRRREPPDPAFWRDVVQVGQLVRQRAGVEAEAFRVYRVVMRDGAPASRLPRPGGP
ncbi:MAG TPA: glycosyltransferase family 39 protein [Acetobacteraceae bacterium]|nr:glycosyltransferase family 39 protein [Acetobacteraceae bacterium]